MNGKTESLEKKTVLIVEDEKFLQVLLRNTLAGAGYNTIPAEDGETAVNLLPTLTADLIILDLMLPKLGGVTVLETIRADKRLKDIPVLVLSNAYLPEMAKNAFLAGATAGLNKSDCTPLRLLENVRALLQPALIREVKLTLPKEATRSSFPPSDEKPLPRLAPNSPECRARQFGFGERVDCLVDPPQRCEFAVSFGDGFLCRHPDSAQIAARTTLRK